MFFSIPWHPKTYFSQCLEIHIFSQCHKIQKHSFLKLWLPVDEIIPGNYYAKTYLFQFYTAYILVLPINKYRVLTWSIHEVPEGHAGGCSWWEVLTVEPGPLASIAAQCWHKHVEASVCVGGVIYSRSSARCQSRASATKPVKVICICVRPPACVYFEVTVTRGWTRPWEHHDVVNCNISLVSIANGALKRNLLLKY